MLSGSLLPSGAGNESIFPSLTLQQRVIGWLSCYLAGVLITLLSFGSFAALVLGHPLRFAFLYTLGNITALMSTCFLVGPRRQFLAMKDPVRLVPSIVYLGTMIATLVLCFKAPSMRLLIVLLIVFQWLSLLWYSITFIPFASNIIRRLVTS